MKRMLTTMMCCAAMAFFAYGCGGGNATVATDSRVPPPAAAPDWVDNPEKGCGVGTAKYRGNRGLARDAAVGRARNDLSRQIETVNQSMLKDYASQGETDGEDFTEELITQVIRQVTDMTLAGTSVVKTRIQDDEFFALVCLDTQTFADAFDKMSQLSAKQREGLNRRAKAEFKDLDATIAKIRGQ